MRMTQFFAAIVPIDSNGTFAQDQVEHPHSRLDSPPERTPSLSSCVNRYQVNVISILNHLFFIYLFAYLYIGSSYKLLFYLFHSNRSLNVWPIQIL